MGDPFGMMNQMNSMMNQMLGPTHGHQPMLGVGHPQQQQRAPPPRGTHPLLAMDMLGFGHPQQQQRAQPRGAHPLAMDMLGGFGNPFGMMGMMEQHGMTDPNAMMFSQSTMVTFNPDGTQRVVSNSTRKAGDVRETRTALRDGEDERVSVGHHIGERGHLIEKKRDKDGQFRQRQRFVNLNEEEAREFDTEFKHRATRNVNNVFGGTERNENGRRAIESNSRHGGSSSGKAGASSRHHRNNEQQSASATSTAHPIITVPDDDEDTDADVQYVSTQRRGGPTIRELSDEEADAEQRNKRRKGMFGGFFRANEE